MSLFTFLNSFKLTGQFCNLKMQIFYHSAHCSSQQLYNCTVSRQGRNVVHLQLSFERLSRRKCSLYVSKRMAKIYFFTRLKKIQLRKEKWCESFLKKKKMRSKKFHLRSFILYICASETLTTTFFYSLENFICDLPAIYLSLYLPSISHL